MNIPLKFNRDTTTKSLGKRMKKMHPRKLTWNLKITCLKRKVIFQTFIVGFHVGVSKNSDIPKSSILIGFSIINHPFLGTPIHGNTHVHFQGCMPFPTLPILTVFKKRTPGIRTNQIYLAAVVASQSLETRLEGRVFCTMEKFTFWNQKWRCGWWFSLPFSIIYTPEI